MNSGNTITDTIGELRHLQTEMAKGVQALFDAEVKLADAEHAYERTVNLSFLNNTGIEKERTARSKLDAADERLQADLAKAGLNRVRAKLKMLELQQLSTQTISRLIETELRVLK